MANGTYDYVHESDVYKVFKVKDRTKVLAVCKDLDAAEEIVDALDAVDSSAGFYVIEKLFQISNGDR